MTLSIGEIIQNKYRIVGILGHGGMGEVYEGENTLIARRVAIKVLHGHIASQEAVIERFEREAQAAGRIGNDHIMEVLDLGALENGDRFMVMEFLEGETFSERIERLGRLTPEQVYPIVRQLLVGLRAAHGAGIIHRDLKPDNVFVLQSKAGQTDFVKIIDFGISKFTSLGSDMKMTATGAVMGTPYYMSPEQAQGASTADPRSDLYAVGVILYKAITGLVPFDGQTFNELLFKIVLSPLPVARSQRPELNEAFDSIIQKAMSRDVAHRFQSAEDFIAALDNWAEHGTAVTIPPVAGTAQLPASPVEPVVADAAQQYAPTGQGSAEVSVGAGAVAEGTLPEGGFAAVSADGDFKAQNGRLGTDTNGSWANSDSAIPKSSSAGKYVAFGLGGLLCVGGAAFALYSFTAGDVAAEAPSVETNAEAPAASRPPVQEERPASPRGPVVTPVASVTAQDAGLGETAPSAKNQGGSSGSGGHAESASQVARKPVAARPRRPTRPRPARPRPAKPKPAPIQPKKSSGDPDFGY